MVIFLSIGTKIGKQVFDDLFYNYTISHTMLAHGAIVGKLTL